MNQGDLGSIPRLGRPRDEGNGNSLQYSCLKNPVDGEATVHGVTKSQTWLRMSTRQDKVPPVKYGLNNLVQLCNMPISLYHIPCFFISLHSFLLIHINVNQEKWSKTYFALCHCSFWTVLYSRIFAFENWHFTSLHFILNSYTFEKEKKMLPLAHWDFSWVE